MPSRFRTEEKRAQGVAVNYPSDSFGRGLVCVFSEAFGLGGLKLDSERFVNAFILRVGGSPLSAELPVREGQRLELRGPTI